MSQVPWFGVAGSKAWRRRSVFLPGTCDTNQSHVPFIVAGLPSFFRPATINNQTRDVCQRDFLANLLPSVEDGRCGRGLRGGWARAYGAGGQGLRGGLAGPARRIGWACEAVRPSGAIPPTALRLRAPPVHAATGGYAVRSPPPLRSPGLSGKSGQGLLSAATPCPGTAVRGPSESGMRARSPAYN